MTESNREIVESIFAASAGQDWALVKSHLHDDVQVHEADSLPYAGTFTGKDAFIELNQQVAQTWKGSQTTIEHW